MYVGEGAFNSFFTVYAKIKQPKKENHMQPTFVSATDLKNLEQYASWVVVAITSLRSMELYNAQALRIGILDEDEREQVATVMWEIKRLLSQYGTLINHLLERTELKEDVVIEFLKKMIGTENAITKEDA